MSKILLTGSSIFEHWDTAASAAPEHTVINRALGGTITPYWTEHLSTVLAQENPDVLWFYCGSNDLCRDTIPDDISDNTIQCRAIVAAHNPTIQFAYFSIIKAPQKKDRWDVIDSIHTDIRSRMHPKDLFVDLNDIFFPKGEPMHGLFVEDGLHLTNQAYDAMITFTRPPMQKWLNG